MDYQGITSKKSLKLGFLFILCLIRCTLQQVKFEKELLNSEIIAQNPNIKVVSEPTIENPSLIFSAFKEIKTKETYNQTQIFKYKVSTPAWTSVIGTGLASSLTGFLLTKNGSVVLGRDLIALGTLPIIGTGFLSLITKKKISQSEELHTDLVPCGAEIWFQKNKLFEDLTLSSHLTKASEIWFPKNKLFEGQNDEIRTQRLDLSKHLNVLPGGRDIELTIITIDSPKIYQKLIVGKEVISYLKEQEEIRIQKEKEEQEREKQRKEEERRKEERALDKAVESLTAWDIASLRFAFNYASAEFQYIIIKQMAQALKIKTYGEFLNLPLRTQVWALREIARVYGGGVIPLQSFFRNY